MFQELIGKQSTPVKNTVELGSVRAFSKAIGDPSPIYTDEEVGKRSRYGTNLAPPTYPRVFDYGVIEEFNLPNVGLIHGKQTFHYNRPLLVGETVMCTTALEDYYERNGKSGLLGFLILKRVGKEPDGETIFTEEQVVIITEAVRRGMSS
ncbi:MaoC family dehydratase N-terminal domain-containing protein [Bacillus sp. NTK071]|uniref:MaoC family dehydratase N-terminal domain-containing protein n=1 Tax=Bacillus sp. NTK071 TaxID=2802175 RepID=UPI001A8F7028|nr:MaoC family dehydratase N-terminal domain-containing protein [Bacillus sp. NTK071]MBN8207764.1 MaoC family dehydratase N-terminal domain-containing protein [Bacillus sp. NTK071]